MNKNNYIINFRTGIYGEYFGTFRGLKMYVKRRAAYTGESIEVLNEDTRVCFIAKWMPIHPVKKKDVWVDLGAYGCYGHLKEVGYS